LSSFPGYVVRIASSVFALMLLAACQMTPEGGYPEPRRFTITVNNTSGIEHTIGLLYYDEKSDVLGESIKSLHERSQQYTLPVDGKLSFDSVKQGNMLTYNYASEGTTYGRRSRWRPGESRIISIVYEFRDRENGYLVQVAED